MLRRWTASVPTLALFALLLPAGTPQAAAASVPPEPVVVRFDDRVTERQQGAVLAASGLTLVDQLPGSDFALAQSSGDADRPVSSLIEEVEPLVTYRASGVPDDPAYRGQWHLPAIDAASAWDVTSGSGTIVAVIDTGVAYETNGPYVQAPDLAGTSFAPGWDFVSGDAHPNDENGHGTHVAGSIAETTGNGLGGAGVAPGATIMPLRVLDAEGSGSDFNLAQAIRFAADHGAAVANLSLGGPTTSDVVRDAIGYARSHGVVVVASSGNDGSSTVSYPAAEVGVVAVGSVRYDRTRPPYSSYGTALDLVAPGGDLSVDQDHDGFPDGILQQTFAQGWTTFCMCFMQGTSMAAPQVSAVAALVAARGTTDPEVIEQVLKASALDLGPAGRDDQYGAGLVQAGAAVRVALPGAPDPASVPIAPPRGLPAPTVPAPTGPAPTLPVPTVPDVPVLAPTVPALPVIVPPVAVEPPPPPLIPDASAAIARGIEHACPAATTPVTAFTDLAETIHGSGITCAAWWGVASGRTSTLYGPSGSVTRGQLASFVARTLESAGLVLPVDPPDAFADDAGSVHEGRIDQLVALRVVQGRSDGTFAPDVVVTRAEMATFLVRAHDALAAVPLAAGPDRFADDDASVHAANIDKIAEAGLAGGTATGAFSPTAPVQRGQMATFLARTLDLFVAEGDTARR